MPELLPLPIPGIGTALTVAGAINKVAQGDFKSLLFPTSGISKFTGKRSERDLIGGDLNPTDALKGNISLSGPFNVASFRDQASFLANDSSEISRVGANITRQLNFLGFSNESAQLNNVLNAGSSQAALNALGSVKTAINQQLGEPGFTFRGIKGADILDEFSRLDTISFTTTKLPKIKNLVTQFQQQIGLANENLRNPDLDRAFQLNELNIVGKRLKKENTEFNALTSQLNTARSGLRGFLDPGFKFPRSVEPDVGQRPQRKQPNDKGQLARTALRAARLFIRPRLPKQPGFQTGEFVSRASSLGGSSGDIFELEKEEDRIIPSGFISKQATTENRALALNSLR